MFAKQIVIALIALVALATSAFSQPPIKFTDLSKTLSFVHKSSGGGLGGAAILDYDADGHLDLFLTNGIGGKNALYRNNGNGTMTDVAAAAGVAGTGTGFSGVVAGDIDNDGYPDLFLTGEGGLMGTRQSPTRLYHNTGKGTFVDISATAKVPGAETSFSAAMGDIDNDGFLDIFITSPGSLASKKQHKNTLYRNNGNLTFTDISKSAGIDTSLGACVVSFTDFDRDGRQDIMVGVCNDVSFKPTPFKLFRNLGNLKFVDVAAKAGLTKPGFWMSMSLGDIDNDGDLDVFSTSLGNSTPSYRPHVLYRNNGNGTYTDIAAAAGVANWEFGWGAVLNDFDNDGNLDLFYAGSLPMPPFRIIGPGKGSPGRLFFNDGKSKFKQIAGSQPVNVSSRYTSGVTQADFDQDGFADLVVMVQTLSSTNLGRPVLLRNGGNKNSWLTVRPVGTKSNRGGVGAFIEVFAGARKFVREVRAGSSVLSSESPWPTFGVGSATSATVRIRWPSGAVDIYTGVRTRQTVTLVEGKGRGIGTYTPLGTGCRGTGGVPLLGALANRLPNVGKPFGVQVTSLPANAPVILMFGLSKSRWGASALPLSLDILGMKGCTAYQSSDLALPMSTAGTVATWSATLPNDPAIVGAEFYNQAVVVDKSANTLGATVSNAAAARIGAR